MLQFFQKQKMIVSQTSFHHAKTACLHTFCEKCYTYQNLILAKINTYHNWSPN